MRLKRKILDNLYLISLIAKGFDGIMELLGGVALLMLTPIRLDRLTDWLTYKQLNGSPDNVAINLALNAAQKIDEPSREFLIIFLLSHAAIKLVSVVGLMRNEIWAYPFAVVTFTALGLYQLYELVFVEFTVMLALFTAFDVFVVWVVAAEWRMRKRKHHLAILHHDI